MMRHLKSQDIPDKAADLSDGTLTVKKYGKASPQGSIMEKKCESELGIICRECGNWSLTARGHNGHVGSKHKGREDLKV